MHGYYKSLNPIQKIYHFTLIHVDKLSLFMLQCLIFGVNIFYKWIELTNNLLLIICLYVKDNCGIIFLSNL